MGMIEDIMKTLERIPGWKRIKGLPAEVDELKARIAALESSRGGSASPCPLCGAVDFTRQSTDDTLSGIGFITDHFQCGQCGHKEDRQRDVLQQ